LNNLEITSILNKSYSEYFGFTKEDLSVILNDYNLLEKEELIKKWYN
jgi:hypothetical protein